MKKNKKWIKDLLPYIVIAVVVILIRTFIITPIMVHGDSMEPTLDGSEVMMLSKVSKIDRFDIVIFTYGNDNLIKRVVGLPGETVAYKNGMLYINDKVVSDDYDDGHTGSFETLQLRDDEYYVMGDNREVSKDSRYIGAIKEKQILGTTNFVIFPFKKFGTIN